MRGQRLILVTVQPDWQASALGILRRAVDAEAMFRQGQMEAIQAAVTPGSRSLVVQRTGWGKSLVYFVATQLLRQSGKGPTLLVSPLLSLMRNQQDMARRVGVRSASINSTNRDMWPELERSVLANELDLLLVSPERLGNPTFAERLLPWIEQHCGLLVVDEAHCISDWGHDFRPDYRRILSTVGRLSPDAAILGTTATANDRVIADVANQLGSLQVMRGPLMRESLRLRVVRLGDQAERLAFLAKYIPKLPGTGIVYALTVADVKRIAEWLCAEGIQAAAYHADLESNVRESLEDRFQRNELKVLCATTALGMGYDKGDVSFVIHFQRPGSIIAYYQQIGRAGRTLKLAEVVLLEGWEDDEINMHFIESAFPNRGVFEAIQARLSQGDVGSINALVSADNYTHSQVEKAVRLMEVAGAIRRENRRYVLANEGWEFAELRSEEVVAARKLELAQMREYAETTRCRMEFLARALDDPTSAPCGRCDRCRPAVAPSIDHTTTLRALRFLQRHVQVIEPKKMFPAGVFAEGRKKIPDAEVLEQGLALGVYGDAGWGKLVRQGKYHEGRYSDELLEPAVAAIRSMSVVPEWLTWIPSLRHPELVSDFGRRLADALGIPALACFERTEAPEQKSMHNASRQFLNVWTTFRVAKNPPRAAGLLFDDIVDSGWTLTACGILLLRAGASKIVPFALTSARPREDS